MRIRLRGIAPALVAALLAGGVSGCFQNSYDMQCVAEGGAIQLAWTPDPAYQRYRVYRVTQGAEIAPVSEVDGVQWTDAGVAAGAQYHYLVRPIDDAGVDAGDAGGVGACSVLAEADENGPPAVADLTCRPKDGKIDLAWSPVPGALSYRVSRSGGGAPVSEIADVGDPVYADQGLVNGSIYEYAVVAVDASGHASPNSNAATCKPVARGEGDPPPVVAAPTCRGKNDKVDVSWTPVAGAAFYRVSRVQGGNAPVLVGEVSGNVIADFGLPLDVAQQYSVASVSATGAVAAASEACSVTPRGRADGNRAPVFTSEPLTSALELHFWWTQLAATDPDDDAITYSMIVHPNGMTSTPAGLLSWTPAETQLGPAVVEVRATDARGAYASQAFSVNVADFDEPPKITTIPVKIGEVGQPYLYDVDAFDAEGGALQFSFGAAAPNGMTIDPASGVIAWTPAAGDVGSRSIEVRAADPSGAFDEQTYALDVFTGAVEVLAPMGEFEVEVGETLDLEIRANQPAAKLIAYPLPRGATSNRGRIVFTPTDDQVGQYTIGVKAILGRAYDLERITVRVTRGNRPPALADPGPQQVDEGGELVVPLSATDPDGDTISLSSAALPTNALLDSLANRLVFRPSYEQSGSVEVVIAASDGEATTEVTVPIEVVDREAPVGFSELVIDRVQSPTLQPRVRISGNVVGDPSGDPEPEAFVAVNGLSPSIGRQGRTLDVAIAGLNTEFAAGQTAANFGEGITVESLEVLSPTSARAHIVIAPDAALGTRVVTLSGNGPAASSIVAFVVEKGAIVFSGRLFDSFTQQPIVGARVSVNGTLLEGQTDAQGNFSIEGVPPGAQQIVIVTNNYEVRRVDLAFDPSVDVSLDEGIPLDALARPFQPGGSLPRAATVASVLDRGVGGGGAPLSLEQAAAVVQDTLLAVGGDQVGVLDESGVQLNPQIEGDGLLTLTAEGVAAQARGFLGGERITLGDIARNLTNAFDWGPYPPDEAALSNALQRFADAAWEDPADPLNAMALILLNEGTSLSAQPPRVSPSTSFNRFQTFLLVTSLLLPSTSRIEAGVEPFLIENGVDVEAIDDRYAPLEEDDAGGIGAVRVRAEAAFAWIGGWLRTPVAHAQEGGITLPPPNGYYDRDPFQSRSFTRLGKHAVTGFIADATINNAVGALLAASIQATIAYTTGASAGAIGIAAATGYVTALVHGVWGAALDKLVLGFALATIAGTAEPTPPIPERSFIDRKSKKFVLEFEPSVSDATAAFVRYSYELFDFADPVTTDSAAAIVMSNSTLTRSLQNPSKLQFAVPLISVAPGVHYFRVATLQYAGAYDYGLNGARIQFPYEIQPGANPPTSIRELIGANAKLSDYFKANYEVNDTVRTQVTARILANRQQRFGSLLSSFEHPTQEARAQVEVLSKLSEENKFEIEATKTQFDASHAQAKTRCEALVTLATETGKQRGNPADFAAPGSEVTQRVNAVAADTNRPTPLPDESRAKLQEISTAQRDAEIATQRQNAHEAANARLRERAALVARRDFDIARNRTFRYDTVNAAGEITTVTVQLPNNKRRARSLLFEEANAQRAQVEPRSAERTAALERHATASNQFLTDEVPSRVAYEARVTELGATEQELGKQLKDAEVNRDRLEFDAKRERQAASRPLVKYKNGIRNTVRVFGGVSNTLQWQSRISDIVSSLQVLYSEFSAAHRFVNVLRDVPPYSIEPHPNLLAGGAIFSSEKGILEGGVVNEQGGTLDVVYDKGDEEESKSTGFPPEFLAVDDSGFVYAHNGNSPQRFGGRIFRFFTDRENRDYIEREFVGSINYYSLMLGYANPANPVAMTVGMTGSSGGPIETLFIADVQYTDRDGAALNPPRAVLKHLPIGLMNPGQPYNDPATRNHFVARDFEVDSRWRFDGPTDLATHTDAAFSRIYISDGESLYVVKHSLSGAGANQVIEILNQPGRRWAGLAFDLNPEPNFYFADFETGDVFYSTYEQLMAAESGQSLNAQPLVNLGPRRVYDIEVDQGQQALVGATREGFARVPMPIVALVDPVQRRTSVIRLGREIQAIVARGLDGTLFQLLPVSKFEQGRGRARVIARRQASSSDPAVTQEGDVRLAPAGPTQVDLR